MAASSGRRPGGGASSVSVGDEGTALELPAEPPEAVEEELLEEGHVGSAARRAAARQKQVEIGKTRPEYLRYIQCVPKERRTASRPQTPDPKAPSISKRQFDRQLSEWRRRLHEYDDPEEERTLSQYDLLPNAPPALGGGFGGGGRGPLHSVSATASTPSSRAEPGASAASCSRQPWPPAHYSSPAATPGAPFVPWVQPSPHVEAVMAASMAASLQQPQMLAPNIASPPGNWHPAQQSRTWPPALVPPAPWLHRQATPPGWAGLPGHLGPGAQTSSAAIAAAGAAAVTHREGGPPGLLVGPKAALLGHGSLGGAPIPSGGIPLTRGAAPKTAESPRHLGQAASNTEVLGGSVSSTGTARAAPPVPAAAAPVPQPSHAAFGATGADREEAVATRAARAFGQRGGLKEEEGPVVPGSGGRGSPAAQPGAAKAAGAASEGALPPLMPPPGFEEAVLPAGPSPLPALHPALLHSLLSGQIGSNVERGELRCSVRGSHGPAALAQAGRAPARIISEALNGDGGALGAESFAVKSDAAGPHSGAVGISDVDGGPQRGHREDLAVARFGGPEREEVATAQTARTLEQQPSALKGIPMKVSVSSTSFQYNVADRFPAMADRSLHPQPACDRQAGENAGEPCLVGSRSDSIAHLDQEVNDPMRPIESAGCFAM
jgi:hypothetical protein